MSSLYLMQKNKNKTNNDHQLPSSNEPPMSTRRISHYKATIGTTQHDDMLNRLWKIRKTNFTTRKGKACLPFATSFRDLKSNCILHLERKNLGGSSQSSLLMVDDFRYHKHLLFWQPLPKRFAPVLIHG